MALLQIVMDPFITRYKSSIYRHDTRHIEVIHSLIRSITTDIGGSIDTVYLYGLLLFVFTEKVSPSCSADHTGDRETVEVKPYSVKFQQVLSNRHCSSTMLYIE